MLTRAPRKLGNGYSPVTGQLTSPAAASAQGMISLLLIRHAAMQNRESLATDQATPLVPCCRPLHRAAGVGRASAPNRHCASRGGPPSRAADGAPWAVRSAVQADRRGRRAWA